MFKWFVRFNCPYLIDAPDDGSGGGDLDVLEDIKDENDKEDKEDDKENKEIIGEVEEENEVDSEDEESDEKSEESDEDEEDEDTEELDRITHASDLKKAYPDIFKKFPDVKAALYRDQQYAELLGSPKEAETLVKKGNLLDIIEKQLIVDGDAKDLLASVKKDSAESFTKIAYSFLPLLAEMDKETYIEVAAYPIKQLCRSMIRKFDKATNEYKAALYVHKYFFDNLDVDSKIKLEEGVKSNKSPREIEYENKLKEIDQRDGNAFFSSTNESYVAKLNREFRIELDKNENLSDWLKGTIVEKGLQEIKSQLDNDPRFKRQMESLWAQAKTSGYSNDLKSRIVSTALARAKSLLPKVRAKLIAEALGKKQKVQKKDDKKGNVTNFERKPHKPTNQPAKSLTDIDLLRGKG